MQVRSLGWEDPLEEGVASHSSILAWRIPWTGSVAAHSPWGCKVLRLTEHFYHSGTESRACLRVGGMYSRRLLPRTHLKSHSINSF